MGIAMDRAKALEAEAKALRRAEKKFWSDVDERRDEVVQHLGVGHTGEDMSDSRWQELADAYDTTQDILIEYVRSTGVRKHFGAWLQRFEAGQAQ